jgi:hypothetical protein
VVKVLSLSYLVRSEVWSCESKVLRVFTYIYSLMLVLAYFCFISLVINLYVYLYIYYIIFFHSYAAPSKSTSKR